MFLPENQKRLTNVSVVSLKKFGKRYELAVYPNKLYEYRNGMNTPLSEILHTDQIFVNVSKEVCSEQHLKPFRKTHREIIEEILAKGIEQKDSKTREFELRQTENEIINFVRSKVLCKGRYMSTDVVRELVNRFKIDVGNSKPQALTIARKLVEMGYEKVRMVVEIVDKSSIVKLPEAYACLETRDGILKISTDVFPKFRQFCGENNIRFRILPDEDVVEEEIC